MKKTQSVGIPTVVWLSPILPFINDTEENIRGILNHCIRCGVKGIICFGMGVTLRDGSAYEINSPHNNQLMSIFNQIRHNAGILHTPNDIFEYLHEIPSDEDYEQLNLF